MMEPALFELQEDTGFFIPSQILGGIAGETVIQVT